MSRPEPAQSAKRRKRLLRWLFEGLALLLALYLIHLWQTRDAVVGTAPALSGRLLGGEHYALERPRAKPLLIYFWASWCPVCGLTAQNVERLSRSQDVITVAMQSGSSAEVAAYLAEQGLRYPVLVDERGQIAAAWGVRGVPAFYVVDRENQIRFVSMGYTSTPGLYARMWLAD
jgi:peroxiredoxin